MIRTSSGKPTTRRPSTSWISTKKVFSYQRGDHGAGLSAGQALRVSIARMLYADPELLSLDEATSSLDQGTEAVIMRTIDTLPATITTIIIAHRLSSVEECDHLVWVKQSQVVAARTPKDILPRYLERLQKVGQETSVACCDAVLKVRSARLASVRGSR